MPGVSYEEKLDLLRRCERERKNLKRVIIQLRGELGIEKSRKKPRVLAPIARLPGGEDAS